MKFYLCILFKNLGSKANLIQRFNFKKKVECTDAIYNYSILAEVSGVAQVYTIIHSYSYSRCLPALVIYI